MAYKSNAKSIIANTLFRSKNLNEFLAHIFGSHILLRDARSYKIGYAAKHMVYKTLARRDRWIQCMYYGLHKLNVLSKTILAQVQMADVDNKKAALLGCGHHMKGWEPYFPTYSFKSGYEEYPLKDAGKCPDSKSPDLGPLGGSLFNPCIDSICLQASDNDIKDISKLISTCASLSRKELRNFIIQSDTCPDQNRFPYLLVNDVRNHPEECYNGESKCNSIFVLLRKLIPHYDNLRKVYAVLNNLRIMHEIVADLDAALFSGDLSYLIKLWEYAPPEKPSQVFAVNRPSGLVTKETLLAKYGKHFTEYYKSLDDLPGPHSCISCEKLVSIEKSTRIAKKWKHLSNDAWNNLKNYLGPNNNERIII